MWVPSCPSIPTIKVLKDEGDLSDVGAILSVRPDQVHQNQYIRDAVNSFMEISVGSQKNSLPKKFKNICIFIFISNLNEKVLIVNVLFIIQKKLHFSSSELSLPPSMPLIPSG